MVEILYVPTFSKKKPLLGIYIKDAQKSLLVMCTQHLFPMLDNFSPWCLFIFFIIYMANVNSKINFKQIKPEHQAF